MEFWYKLKNNLTFCFFLLDTRELFNASQKLTARKITEKWFMNKMGFSMWLQDVKYVPSTVPIASQLKNVNAWLVIKDKEKIVLNYVGRMKSSVQSITSVSVIDCISESAMLVCLFSVCVNQVRFISKENVFK